MNTEMNEKMIDFEKFMESVMAKNSPFPFIYQSVFGMVSTLIIENRIDEIDLALRAVFPEYYSDEIS